MSDFAVYFGNLVAWLSSVNFEDKIGLQCQKVGHMW